MALDVALRSLALPAWADRARSARFDDLVGEHQDEVFGVALRILGDRDAALDVANTVFLKAYRSFSRYDSSRPARHWLLRIAVNEAVSAGRAITRDRARRAPEEVARGLPDAAPTPEQLALRRELRDAVRDAVLALPERYRVPIVLRYFADLSLEEISRATGRPNATIGVQLLRGRALLRKALG